MPPVFHRYYVFVGWMLDRAEKFPKNARFTFGQTLTNTLLGILGKIVRAAYGWRKRENLERRQRRFVTAAACTTIPPSSIRHSAVPVPSIWSSGGTTITAGTDV